MANTILHKRSSTASAVPSAGSLSTGELAINTADGKLFTKKADGSVVEVSSNSNHAHGNITSTGAIGATANLPLITTTSGLIATGSFGTSANTFCQGNDSRLADARTPTAHKSTHATLGSDALSPADIGASADNHGHGNITSFGAIGNTSGLPIKTGTAGALEAGSFGTSAGQFAEGNHTHAASAITSGTLGVDVGGTGANLSGTGGTGFVLKQAATGSPVSVAALIANDIPSLAASKITSGTFAIGRIPTGTTSSTVSLGNHTHGNITAAGAIGAAENRPIITTLSGVLTTGAFGTGANSFCQGNDSRLSDARTPTAHTHPVGDLTQSGATTNQVLIWDGTSWAPGNVSGSGTVTSVTAGTGLTGGTITSSGTITVDFAASGSSTANKAVEATDSRLSDSRTPTSHTHGSITNAGAIGSTANLPIITGASGVLEAGSFGTAANTFCQGNDSRLSNARTPTAHATSHGSLGTDPLSAMDIGAANAVHDHNASDIARGTLAIARGGLGFGTTPTNGQIPIGNGTGYTLATLTQGSGVTITNGAGTITIAATGGSGSVATDTIWASKGDLAVATGDNTATVLPIGGTNGHVLTIDLTEATGMKWAAATGGSGSVATDTIWEAKGDLAIATANNTATVLTVGTNGHVLTADSGEATGLRWVAPKTIATDTIWAAKGDLAMATGNDAASVLTVGTNGTILVADSAEATGARWGTVEIPTKSFTAGTNNTTTPGLYQTVRYIGTTTGITVPSGATYMLVVGCGAGGGGGGGQMQATAAAARAGGGGGQGGQGWLNVFRLSEIGSPSTIQVTIGAGGNGGVGANTGAATVNGTNGSDGGASLLETSGGTLIARFPGGSGGAGGANTNAAGGSTASFLGWTAGFGGRGGRSTATGYAGGNNYYGGGGGGGGGGNTTTNADTNCGDGGASGYWDGRTPTEAASQTNEQGTARPTTVSTVGNPGSGGSGLFGGNGGSGGTGNRTTTTGSAGAGGAGGEGGGGGGGGGARVNYTAVDGSKAGDGGKGGGGYITLRFW